MLTKTERVKEDEKENSRKAYLVSYAAVSNTENLGVSGDVEIVTIYLGPAH